MQESQTPEILEHKSPCLSELETGNSLQSVSVIVLNWNQKKLLNNCLESVLNTDYSEMEIIVSDNGSTDGSVKMVKKNFANVVLIENNANLGFCEGNNIAIKRAKGDIIVLLNNDTWVDKNWINEIVNAASDSKVGIVGCKLLFVGTNVIQSLGYRSNLLGHYVNRGLLEINDGKYDNEEVADVDYVSGAALAIKRLVVDAVGFLDPMFYAYFEDVDWCYRVKELGYKVVVAQKAVVHHCGSVSWNSLSFKKVYLTERNRFLFIFKHYSGLNLLRALTFHEFKSALRLIRDKLSVKDLTVNLVTHKTGKPRDLKKRSKYYELAKAILDWIGAKSLAYFSIPFILFSLRKKD